MSLRHKLTDHSLGVVSVALSTDCRMLASSSLDSAIHIWDTNTGRKMGKINGTLIEGEMKWGKNMICEKGGGNRIF